ncbi:MAG: hypothetical protein WBJ99_01820 [Bacteroidales bacterium]
MNKERYTKQLLYKRSLEIIEEYTPINISKLISFLGVSKDTFYRKIKANSKEYEKILEALKRKKLFIAEDMLAKARELANNGNLKAIEYCLKIYGDNEIREALSNNYNVNAKATIDSEKERQKEIERLEKNFKNLTKEERKQFEKLLAKIYSK